MNNLKPDEPFYQISQVAKLVGISADRLRTYEEEGLIKPYRKNGSNSNRRLFSQNDIDYILTLRQLIKLGFSIPAIRIYLNSDFSINLKNILPKDREIVDLLNKLNKWNIFNNFDAI